MNFYLKGFIQFIFLCLPFSAYASDLKSENRIEPEILMPYDPSAIKTLAIGVGRIESQRQFFGGNCYMGRGQIPGNALVTWKGEILTNNPSKHDIYHLYKIPDISLDHNQEIIYSFINDKGLNITHNKQAVLDWQGRAVKSAMETDPKTTLYLDLCPPPLFSFPGEEDTLHLRGDIFKITHLPNNLKVERILIQYLGDYVFGRVDFNTLDWQWLNSLHTLLKKPGNVLFEMRVSLLTKQDKDFTLPLSLFQEHIKTILIGKFESCGYATTSQFFPKGSVDHIPVRFYDTILITATSLRIE